MPIPDLQDFERDALTRVCDAGVRQAATALSQLIGIEVPRLQVLEPGSLAGHLASGEVAGLNLQIHGKVRGSILILLPLEDARHLLQLLLGESPLSGAALTELEASALLEVGNILASACLNALGSLLDLTLLPSVPLLKRGDAVEVLTHALGEHSHGEPVLLIDTSFSSAEAPCSGSILLIPALASLNTLISCLASR